MTHDLLGAAGADRRLIVDQPRVAAAARLDGGGARRPALPRAHPPRRPRRGSRRSSARCSPGNAGDRPETELRLRARDGSYRWFVFSTSYSPADELVFFSGKDVTARKQGEEELRAAEERFRAVTGSTRDGIVSADLNGRIIFWNAGAEAIFGRTARGDARPHAHRADARALPRRAPRGHRPLPRHRRGPRDRLDRRGRGPARRRHRVPARAVARLLEPERPDCASPACCATCRDRVRARQRAARGRGALRRRVRGRRGRAHARRARTARCCAPTARCASCRAGPRTSWSGAASTSCCTRTTAALDAAGARRHARRPHAAARHRAPLPVAPTAAARVVRINLSLIRDADEAPLHFVGQIEDVTERRRMVEALTISEARYKGLIAHLPDSTVHLFDHDLRLLLSEGDRMRAHGYDPQELEGRLLAGHRAAGASTTRLAPEYRAALAGETRSFDLETRATARRPTGCRSRRCATSSAASSAAWRCRATSPRGAPPSCALEDRARRARALQRRARAVRLRRLARPLRAAAHGLELPPAAAPPLPRQARRRRRRVHRLRGRRRRADARPDRRPAHLLARRPRRRAARARSTAARSWSAWSRASRRSRTRRDARVRSGDLPAVLGDAQQLGQLFQNLIGNAVKFVPEDRAPRSR